MKTIGIICEYNPFHTGHLHQLESVKRDGAAVICLMSGNTTQRGELAITDKFTRAACAIRSGADLVLELPFPFCSSSADYFAGAGVSILSALSADEINFGSESADRDALLAAARASATDEFDRLCKDKLAKEKNLGAAEAYFDALASLSVGALASNDMLGVAYFRAAIRLGCEDLLTLTKREGSAYGEKNIFENTHPSATALRELIKSGDGGAFELMPDGAAEIMKTATFADASRLSSAILSFFRLSDPALLANCAEAGGGLSFRLCSAARESSTLSEFYEKAAAKRYTSSRVRRAVLYCILGVTPLDLVTPPTYLQLLGANQRGCEILSNLKRTSPIPIVTKPADAAVHGREFELSSRLDSLYTLALDPPKRASEYIKQSPFIDFSEKH